MHEYTPEYNEYSNDDEVALNSIREIVKNHGIRETIENMINKINELLEQNDFASNSKEIIDKYKYEIRIGKINHDTIINNHFKLFTTKTKKAKEATIILQCLTLIAYASIAEENNSLLIAWNLISRANFNLGLYNGLTDPEKSAHAERGRVTTEKRLKKSEAEYALLIHLINDLKPCKGWRSKLAAAETIGKEIVSRALKEGTLRGKSTEELKEIEENQTQHILNCIIVNSELSKIYESKPQKNTKPN